MTTFLSETLQCHRNVSDVRLHSQERSVSTAADESARRALASRAQRPLAHLQHTEAATGSDMTSHCVIDSCDFKTLLRVVAGAETDQPLQRHNVETSSAAVR